MVSTALVATLDPATPPTAPPANPTAADPPATSAVLVAPAVAADSPPTAERAVPAPSVTPAAAPMVFLCLYSVLPSPSVFLVKVFPTLLVTLLMTLSSLALALASLSTLALLDSELTLSISLVVSVEGVVSPRAAAPASASALKFLRILSDLAASLFPPKALLVPSMSMVTRLFAVCLVPPGASDLPPAPSAATSSASARSRA